MVKHGGFYIRSKVCEAMPELNGAIIYAHSETEVSFLNGCAPTAERYTLPDECKDDNWIPLVDLVLQANTIILPKYENCCFVSSEAQFYRNHLGEFPKDVSIRNAAPGLYFIGKKGKSGVRLSTGAYYLVAFDASTSILLSFADMCLHIREGESKPTPKLTVIVWNDSFSLYPAEPIVQTCNSEYTKDKEKAEKFARIIRDTVSNLSADSTARARSGGVSEMRLGQ